MTDRSYLSIGEVLAELQEEFPDVTISKIRFLESQGLIDPERTPSGYRKFYDDDIGRLRFILREQKDNFLPLRVIKDRLEHVEGALDPVPDERADSDAQHVGAVSTPVATLVSAPPVERLPIWMHRSTEAKPEPVPATASPTAPDPPDGASLTIEELASCTGLTAGELREVERFGLIAGHQLGRSTFYDSEAVSTARLVARFSAFGIEPRHLRMYRTAAEREAAVYEQIILPLVKQRNPQARADATARLKSMAALGGELRDAMLRQSLRAYTGEL